jgi:hypothetical protein
VVAARVFEDADRKDEHGQDRHHGVSNPVGQGEQSAIE